MIFRLRITQLEAELARRDQEFTAQKFHLLQLQRELEAKLSQINKLQDAIGYTNGPGHSPPPASLLHLHRRFSVINQGSRRFQRVAVEVHRRLRAKEGVSAEPTSENFCQEVKAAHVSKAVPKDSQWVSMSSFLEDEQMQTKVSAIQTFRTASSYLTISHIQSKNIWWRSLM